MNKEQLEDLRTIYRLILSTPDLLIDLSAKRGISIREGYVSVLEELEKLEGEIKRSM
jgi:hypothetical protein